MTERNFAYWLQGYIELTGAGTKGLNANQRKDCILAHIKLVRENQQGELLSTIEALCSLKDRHEAIKVVMSNYFEKVVDWVDPNEDLSINPFVIEPPATIDPFTLPTTAICSIVDQGVSLFDGPEDPNPYRDIPPV